MYVRSELGFSLPEVMVALALAGGIGLMTMKIMSEQKANEALLKTRAEISKAVSIIKANLNVPEKCTSILVGRARGVNLASNDALRARITRTNELLTLIQPNTNYPGNFRTGNIRVVDSKLGTPNSADLLIEFRVKKLGTNLWGSVSQQNAATDRHNVIEERIPLVVTWNTAVTPNVITSCGPIISDRNTTAMEKFCLSLGGAATWEASSQRCRPTQLSCPFGRVPSRVSDGTPTCKLLNQDLDKLFDTTSTCSHTGTFRIVRNAASNKLMIVCN
jgi:prepilin-type N-terminal cleavage/methylation domain-containing protein